MMIIDDSDNGKHDQLSKLQNDKNDHHWLGMESNCIESLMLVDY